MALCSAIPLAILAAATLAPPAAAHGIQGRADLPIPVSMFYWAAMGILVVSFAALVVAWRKPLGAVVTKRTSRIRFYDPYEQHSLRQRAAALLVVVARIVSVGIFGLTIATAFLGSTLFAENFAPIFIFVVWWIGIALCAATIGDVWRLLHPVAAIARTLQLAPRHIPGARPTLWLAIGGLFIFIWLELVFPTAAHVRMLGVLIVAWALMTLVGMRKYGIDAWLDAGEPFSAYTKVLSRIGLLAWARLEDDRLRVDVHPPFVGAMATRLPPRGSYLVALLIGSVSFDGLSRTIWWTRLHADAVTNAHQRGVDSDISTVIVKTIGLMVMVAAATILLQLAARTATKVGQLEWHETFYSPASAFAPSLIPIAFAYVVAHYFSFFWFQGQGIIPLLSDPFGDGRFSFIDPLGRGWMALDTSTYKISYDTLSAQAIWYVQVGAIVVGHVIALLLAHDRALELADNGDGEPHNFAQIVAAQLPMLALMLAFTVGGLYFLSEGMNG